jgi:hypothetical protein
MDAGGDNKNASAEEEEASLLCREVFNSGDF